MSSRRAWALTAAGVLLTLSLLFVRVHSPGDWTAGVNNAYCGIYWPRMDFYCEHAR